MNSIRRSLLLTSFLAFLFGFFSPAQGDTPRDLNTKNFIIRIEKHGDAVFFQKQRAIISRRWTISCHVARNGCSARNGPLRLRLDSSSRVWLSAMTPLGSRISIQVRNLAYDTPDLFSSPLTDDYMRLLSITDAFLNVEIALDDSLHVSTTGLDLVVGYLRWVGDPENHPMNDAREWQPIRQLANEKDQVSSLEHHRFQSSLEYAANRRIIPYTKPQIEFAIRAQTNYEENE